MVIDELVLLMVSYTLSLLLNSAMSVATEEMAQVLEVLEVEVHWDQDYRLVI